MPFQSLAPSFSHLDSDDALNEAAENVNVGSPVRKNGDWLFISAIASGNFNTVEPEINCLSPLFALQAIDNTLGVSRVGTATPLCACMCPRTLWKLISRSKAFWGHAVTGKQKVYCQAHVDEAAARVLEQAKDNTVYSTAGGTGILPVQHRLEACATLGKCLK